MNAATAMTERELTDAVIDLARVFGWRVAHQRPARTSTGWRTATQGDVGWPDIVTVRNGRLVVAELKSERGQLTPEQSGWLEDLASAGVQVAVWRPRHWLDGTIEETFR